MFWFCRVGGELVKVDPLCGEAAIEKMFPSNVVLTSDKVFEGLRIFRGVDGWGWPVLEAQEEEAFDVVRAAPCVAVGADCAEKVVEHRVVR